MQLSHAQDDLKLEDASDESTDQNTPLIVLVDDEVNALLGLRRALRNRFRVKAIDCPTTALEYLETAGNIAVIVSDLQMPYMDGLAFLDAANALQPNASLVILTGNPNGDTAIRAINSLGVAKYLTKPCTTTDLIETLSDGLSKYEQKRSFAQHTDALDALAKAKNAMFSTVSHELRTPLHHIALCADLLEAGERNAVDVSDYVSCIKNSCAQLESMVTRIMEYAKLRGMEALPSPGFFSIKKLFRDSWQHLEAQAAERGIDAAHATHFETEWCHGDELLLFKAVEALVSNALKFCRSDDKISVAMFRDSRLLRIEVADTGPGLKSDRYSDVFEPFFQEDGGYTREHGGLGLGLSFVREVARLHGGKLGLVDNSNEGRGLIAEIVVPVHHLGGSTLMDGTVTQTVN